jgi:hypothetical protein
MVPSKAKELPYTAEIHKTQNAEVGDHSEMALQSIDGNTEIHNSSEHSTKHCSCSA